jgi:hygromycin-B 7''-O-kinase
MLFPAIDVESPWERVRERPLAAFAPVLDALRARWGLPGEPFERLPGGEDCAAFGLTEHVIKLLPPGSDPSQEETLLTQLAGALSAPTPRLLGRFDAQGWTALWLSRLAGRPVGAVWPSLDEPTRLRLLGELGTVAREFRALPAGSTRRPDLRARATRHGAAALAWIDRWAAPGPPVLLHGDLTDENVFVDRVGGEWRLSGVLDFGGCFVAEAPIELVSPALFLGRGVHARIDAFAASAGLAGCAEERLAWHLLHPYSELARDLRMCGLPADAPLEVAVTAWGTPVR